MQSTLSIPATHPTRQLLDLAKQIALPHEYAPQRFPSFPAIERTAVIGFSAPLSLEAPNNFRDTKLMLCRQAAFPLWANLDTEAAPVSWAAGYRTATMPGATTPALSDLILPFDPHSSIHGVVSGTSTGTEMLRFSGATSAPPSAYAPIGLDMGTGSLPFVYVSADATSFIEVFPNSGSIPTTATATLAYEIWEAPGKTSSQSMVLVNFTAAGYFVGSTPIPVPLGGGLWVRPVSVQLSDPVLSPTSIQLTCSIACFTGNSFTYTPGTANGSGVINFTGTTVYGHQTFLPIVSPGEYGTSGLPWSSTRVTAAAVLVTNVTQVMTKAGTAIGGRINPEISSPFLVLKSSIQALHPAEKQQLALETGMYTFCPPSNDMDHFFNYRYPVRYANYVSTATTTVSAAGPAYDLSNTSFVNVMFLTTGAVGAQFALTLDWHLEFRCTSALFQIGMSTITLEAFHQAQLSLARTGFFFENPTHTAVLTALLAAAQPYIGRALNWLAGAKKKKQKKQRPKRRQRQVSKSRNTVYISPKPKPPPPPTTARAAGFNGPKRRSGLDMYLNRKNR